MQKIKFNSELAPKILGGSKKSTLRLGVKPITLGPCQFTTVKGEFIGIYLVTKIEVVKWQTILKSKEIAKLEGYKTPYDLRQAIVEIYGEMFEGEDFTLIHFKQVEWVY